jgi:hypothetical protein
VQRFKGEPKSCVMPYRHHAVIPANYVSASLPEGERDYPCRLTRKFRAPICDEKPQTTYSRSMSAAGILFACSAVILFISGSPMASQAPSVQEAVNVGTKQAIQNWSFDIFPLAGAMLSAAGICLLHNVSEGKGKIAGRVIFALIGGFVAPWVISMLPLTWHIDDPRGQLLIGVVFGSSGYVFSRYVVEVAFRRALGVTERVADYGEKKLDEKLK